MLLAVKAGNGPDSEIPQAAMPLLTLVTILLTVSQSAHFDSRVAEMSFVRWGIVTAHLDRPVH